MSFLKLILGRTLATKRTPDADQRFRSMKKVPVSDFPYIALHESAGAAAAPLSKTQLTARIRQHVTAQLYDDSCGTGGGTAIYTLSDPRDIRAVRYVGQTTAPRRRFCQHLNTARLWLPDETPWWVKSPKLRPLYEWVRELYRDGCRLPTMVVCEWLETMPQARIAERVRIDACLASGLPLLNVEAEIRSRRVP